MKKRLNLKNIKNLLKLDNLNKLGGTIQLISLLLPTFIISTTIHDTSGFIIIWLFGLAIINFNHLNIFGIYFMPDSFFTGLILTLLLLYLGIISIRREPSELKYIGILSIVLIVSYYVGLYLFYTITQSTFNFIKLNILVIPFIGFFGIIIGALLVVYKSIKS